MYRNLLALLLAGFATHAMAQLEGDTIVCGGNVYTYTANIPGAVSYDWNFPPYWYDASGLGTSTVTVTCNSNSGGVCATGVDGSGNVLGQQCLVTTFGGGGSGFDLVPSTWEGCGSVDVTFTLVPNGTGGGCDACGGTPHPNVVYALYDNDYFPFAHYVGLVDGGPYTVVNPGASFTVFQVDITDGTDYPQAVVVGGGCGGSGQATVGVAVIPIVPEVFSQEPAEACIGETVTITELNNEPGLDGYWDQIVDLDVLDSGNPLVATITGPNASARYQGQIGWCPMELTTYAVNYCISTGIAAVNNTPALRSLGNHRYAVPGALNGTVRITTASGQVIASINAREVDLSDQAPGIYVIHAATAADDVLRWKVMR